MKIIGLTGSIGMGKSVAAKFFMQAGIPVFDADQCVHDLYRDEAVVPMQNVFPEAIVNGIVSREKLSNIIIQQSDALEKIEYIIYPLVREAREKFLKVCKDNNHRFVVFDIPLLFEKQQNTLCDVICVVSAPASIQRQRVLSRPNMSVEKFSAIVAKQMPDSEKRKRAHYCIISSSYEKVERDIADILRSL